MARMSNPAIGLLLGLGILIACGAGEHPAPESAEGSNYRAGIDRWHQGRIERLHRDDGWLSLVGLFALQPGANSFGSASDNDLVFPPSAPARAGMLYLEKGGVRLEAAPGVGMLHDGAAVESLTLRPDISGEPTQIEMGSLLFYVIERNGEAMLRVKDRESALLRSFEGIDRWPVDPRWRVVGTAVPHDPPKLVLVPNVLGTVDSLLVPYSVALELDGERYVLDPASVPTKSIFLVFGDLTNGTESYGGGRFVYADLPDSTGRVTVDFNKAYNPPCVFTPFATCPLPPQQNFLAVEITAGEKMWGDAH
jgi:uncharacterized protein (DUF1684 family)